MQFIKSPDGEQVSAVSDGQTVGFIRKNRFGTHGHWHGWKHYTRCERSGEFTWCGVWASAICPEKQHKAWATWSDEPSVFASIKEFKEYYGGGQK